MAELEIKNLHASVEGKEILKGMNLAIETGEIHSLMGPNGSGKSTLALAVMGHPKYRITEGDVLLDGKSILGLTPDERARAGLFLAFQHPVEVPGVSVSKFLFNAVNALNPARGAKDFQPLLKESLKQTGLSEDFAARALNAGFSGGEKKRNEVLQLSVLKPKIALLDEIDSGLDIDALKTVAKAIKASSRATGMLVITHYQRILHYLQPDFVHVMVGGRVVKSGGHNLAGEIEEKGYSDLLKKYGVFYCEREEGGGK